MKGLIGFVVMLGLLVGFSSPVFATECTDLATQVEDKLANSQASDDKKDQASALLEEGAAACASGDEPKGVSLLNQALALLGN